MRKVLISLTLSVVVLCFYSTAFAQQKADTAQKASLSMNPLASIAGVTGRDIDKSLLLKADSLICCENKSKIISFTMTLIENGNLYEQNAYSNQLTAEMKKSINDMVSGNKLYFENIKVALSDGSLRTLNAISLVIK